MTNILKTKINIFLLCLTALLTTMTGCSHNPISYTTGIVVEGIVENDIYPYVIAQGDTDIACNLGRSFEFFLDSVNEMTDLKNGYLAMMPLLSSVCSEYHAREAELRSIRALRKGDIEGAKDARQLQKQWLTKTAQRRSKSFDLGIQIYDFKSTHSSYECPDFDEERDEITFLLSLTMGALAIKNDAESGMAAGVSRSIASTILKGANCVDNERWGGVPQALQATLWILLPNKKPSDIKKNNWEILEYASRSSITVGFHLGSALHVAAAEIAGNRTELYKALTLYKETAGDEAFNKGSYTLVDTISIGIIHDISNVLWTSEVGSRTPFGQLGNLPPTITEAKDNSEELDSLL
ncbi:MAG: hypothetical protein ACI978_002920 [Oleispira sp.]|jgi:hypothetical protein